MIVSYRERHRGVGRGGGVELVGCNAIIKRPQEEINYAGNIKDTLTQTHKIPVYVST